MPKQALGGGGNRHQLDMSGRPAGLRSVTPWDPATHASPDPHPDPDPGPGPGRDADPGLGLGFEPFLLCHHQYPKAETLLRKHRFRTAEKQPVDICGSRHSSYSCYRLPLPILLPFPPLPSLPISHFPPSHTHVPFQRIKTNPKNAESRESKASREI